MVKKTSRGRQRIPMEKMSNESSLQVTFSKRRSGIMKKSNELSTLTGAEMAVVIFSPGNRVFSFGKPTIETILNKFQNLQIPNNPQPNTNTLTETMYQLDQEGKLRKLNEETDLLKEECEVERKIKELMDQISEIEEKNNNLCSEDSIENHVGLLEKLKDAFQEFNQIVEKKVVKNQNILLEIQREHSFHFQNVFKHPHDVNIENTSGYMPTFGNYDVSRDVCGFSSQVYAAGPSIFGGGGFHFSQGEANSSMNNGVPMEAPEVGSYAGTSTFGGGGFQFIHGETNSSINNGVPMTAPAVCSYAEPSTFGGGGFQFIQGEASNNINNVARLAAPVVGSYAGTSTFGDGGFNFIQGEESSGINNGVPMAAPTIDSYGGTSTFVDGCFNIIQGEASSNINNGVPLAVPAVGGYTGPSTYVDSGFNFIQGEASCGINTSVPVAAPTIAGYAGTSTFGGDGFQFIQGEASSSLNTGIPVVAPTVGCYVGASTFGGSGGGASSSINNGVQMNVPPLAVAPSAVDRFVVPHYDPNIQDEVFFPAE